MAYAKAGRVDTSRPLEMGVAYFEHRDKPEMGGYYSEPGGAAKYFSHPRSLAHDIIWITNSSLKDLRGSGCGPNIKPDSYFASSLNQISMDLNLHKDYRGISYAAEKMGAVVSRVGKLIEQHYGIKSLNGIHISNPIQEKLFPGPRVDHHAVRNALVHAHQRFTDCSTSAYQSNKNLIKVPVRRNRMEHVLDVFHGVVPGGGWVPASADQLGETNDQRLSTLFNCEQPFLVEASVLNEDPDEGILFGFNKDSKPNASVRRYLTHTELLFAVKIAEVKVHGAQINIDSTPLNKSQALPLSLTQDPLNFLSYSAQLVAEAHLSAAIKSTPSKKRSYGTQEESEPDVSEIACFYSARSRMLTYLMARKLAANGFLVTGYQNGSVWINVDPSELFRLSDFVQENGWAFPLPESLEHLSKTIYVHK